MKTEKLRIAIQGIKGAFHEEAAREYYQGQEIEIVECASFRAEAKALFNGDADFALMAIENTLAGSILPNYAIIDEYGFCIVGEIFHPIRLFLMALPSAEIDKIVQVQSHPMALYQSADFLANYPHWQVLEAYDTAGAAKLVAQSADETLAAIAPAASANIYGLKILASDLQTHKLNATRFLVLAKETQIVNQPNTASISLQLANTPGVLAQVLSALEKHQVNLTKIQSIPIIGKPYTYSFHMDIEWPSTCNITDALGSILPFVKNIKVLGFYKRGNQQIVFNQNS